MEEDFNDLDVGASADHSLKSLRTNLVIDISHFLHLLHLVVLWILDVGGPGAVDIPSFGQ